MVKKNPLRVRSVVFLLIALTVVILDQISKMIVQALMSKGQSIAVLKGVFHITYTTNTGAAFSILQGYSGLLVWISVMAIGAIIYFYDRLDKKEFILVAFVLGGIIGNLIDRISYGHVIDFIDFRIWPVFNIADSAVTVGVILLVYYWLRKKK